MDLTLEFLSSNSFNEGSSQPISFRLMVVDVSLTLEEFADLMGFEI